MDSCAASAAIMNGSRPCACALPLSSGQKSIGKMMRRISGRKVFAAGRHELRIGAPHRVMPKPQVAHLVVNQRQSSPASGAESPQTFCAYCSSLSAGRYRPDSISRAMTARVGGGVGGVTTARRTPAVTLASLRCSSCVQASRP